MLLCLLLPFIFDFLDFKFSSAFGDLFLLFDLSVFLFPEITDDICSDTPSSSLYLVFKIALMVPSSFNQSIFLNSQISMSAHLPKGLISEELRFWQLRTASAKSLMPKDGVHSLIAL